MKIIKPSFEILTPINDKDILSFLESVARTCYKSEDRITEESAPKFIKMLIDRGHEAMIEHAGLTVKFVVDRGVSHEIVRHRLCSFAQESTRYVTYGNDKGGITVIDPLFFEPDSRKREAWENAMRICESMYLALLDMGATPQEARSVLPNSLKTEIVVTANIREWRAILKLRTSTAAHPQIRQVMIPLLRALQEQIPVLFDSIRSEQSAQNQ